MNDARPAADIRMMLVRSVEQLEATRRRRVYHLADAYREGRWYTLSADQREATRLNFASLNQRLRRARANLADWDGRRSL